MTALTSVGSAATGAPTTRSNNAPPGWNKLQDWIHSDPAIGVGSAAGIGAVTGMMMQTLGVSSKGTWAQAAGLAAAGVGAYAVAHQTNSRVAGMATAAAAGAGAMVLGQLLTPGAKPPSYMAAVGVVGGLIGLFVGGVSTKNATT